MTAAAVGRSVQLTATGLHLDGAGDLQAISGSVHYWRHRRDEWPRILDAFATTGLRIVDVYIPWTVHDDADGGTVWTGNRDVAAYLRLIEDRGLHAIVRVGPHSGAELTDSGYPARVHTDERTWARRCNGLPYVLPTATHHINVPSYFSSVFRDEVEGWYAQMVAQVAPFQWPHGPVVACQVDNEHGYFFQAHAYAMDYHPEALDAYREWLSHEYDGIAALNAAYGTSHTGFDEVEPPRDGRDQPERRRLDWVRWREQALRDTLGWLRGRLEHHGLTRIPFFHNDFPRTDTPLDQGALEASGAVDVAAVDIYATRPGARYVADLVRHAAGSSKLAWLAECGAGWITLPWLLPMAVDPADTEFVAMAALLAGARATNFYMTVERERWYGSPIDRHGNVRPRIDVLQRLTAALRRLRLHELERDAPVLVLDNRAQARRHAARATLGGLVPAFSAQLPFDVALTQAEDGDDRAVAAWRRGVDAVLRAGGVDHDLAVTSSPHRAGRYRVVVVPCARALDRAAWELLTRLSRDGVRVVAGPTLPAVDEHLEPLPAREHDLEVLAEPAALAAHLPQPAFQCEHPALDLYRWSGKGREVLAALNHAATASDVVITAAAPRQLVTVIGEAPSLSSSPGSPARMTLAPWSVSVWEGGA